MGLSSLPVSCLEQGARPSGLGGRRCAGEGAQLFPAGFGLGAGAGRWGVHMGLGQDGDWLTLWGPQ